MLRFVRLLVLLVVSFPVFGVQASVPIGPDLTIAPDTLKVEMVAGDTAWSHFTIGNVGGSPLEFRLGILSLGLVIMPGGAGHVRIALYPFTGTVPPGGSEQIGVRFDAREAFGGWPVGTIVYVQSNDPYEPEREYLITLNLTPAPPIPATLDIRPDELVAGRSRPWITASIELARGFDPAQILVSTVRLAGIPPADTDRFSFKDHDHDGTPEILLRFDPEAVAAALEPGDAVEVVASGNVGPFRTFEGMTTLRVSGGSLRMTSVASTPPTRESITWSAIKTRFR